MFDQEKNQSRKRNADGIRNDDPNPKVWLTGYAYLRASEEGLQMINPDVWQLLSKAGLIGGKKPKLGTDISNAFEEVGMLRRLSARPTVRTVTETLEPFVKRHEARMMIEIGKHNVERAWEHVRNRAISRGPVL